MPSKTKEFFCNILKGLLIFCIILALTGCGCLNPSVKMNVKSSSNPVYGMEDYRRFIVVTWNKENQLEENDLLTIIKDIMGRKGYIYDAQNPDFAISVAFLNTEVKKHQPQRTVYVPHYTPGKTTYHSGGVNVYSSDGYGYGSYSGTSSTSGTWSTEPVTIPASTRKSNHRWVSVTFIEIKEHSRTVRKEFDVLWAGEVESDGSKKLYNVAPCLLEGLLEEFPNRTSRSQKRLPAKECFRK